MNLNDNMGGIISADFIFWNEVNYYATFRNTSTIYLRVNSEWKNLLSKKDGISVTVTPEKTDSGLLFTIKGSVILKKESPYLNMLELSPSILLRYQTPDGRYRVAGTDEYPLQTTLEVLTPSKASGFHGYELSFTGKQLISPPFLTI